MITAIYLDDERICPHQNYLTVRTFGKFCQVIDELIDTKAIAQLTHISFDHDLYDFTDRPAPYRFHNKALNKYEATGKSCLDYLLNNLLDKCYVQDPALFQSVLHNLNVVVHSQNPIGREMIESVYKQFVKQFKGDSTCLN